MTYSTACHGIICNNTVYFVYYIEYKQTLPFDLNETLSTPCALSINVFQKSERLLTWMSALTGSYALNTLNPHNALTHHFTSLKTDLIFLQQRALERKFLLNWFTNTWQFSFIFKRHQIIFIHFKSRIAAAIRGL